MSHSNRALLVVGIAASALTAAAGFADGARPGHLLVPWLLAHTFYLAAVWLVLARGARLATWALLAVALMPRLVLLPAEPRLSEDVYRYLWDGRLVAEGVNPYPQPPTDVTLSPGREALLPRLNHADVPTCYPPMAQLLFGAAARMAPEPWAWKATLLALEAILLLALGALLRARGLPRERLLLYAWNPLVIVESFGGGHLDLAAAAFLLVALALAEARDARETGASVGAGAGAAVGAGIALAAATLVKYMPLLLVPALVRRRAFVTLAAAGVATAILFLPFLSAGRALVTGLTTYLRHWDFNGSLYALIRPLAPNGDATRLILAAALGVAAIWIGRRARTLTGAALALLVAWLLASPTVYPWYLLAAVALLPLHPDRGLLVFSGLVALSYIAIATFRATGVWALPPAVPWIEYGGWVAASATAGAAAWRRRYRRAGA